MKNALGIIIAFDNDNDLRELTEHRTVAAVPFGCRYRVIDFMLSSMVNSGIYRVGVVMRDKYQSLIDHIGSAKDWDLSRKNGGVTLLPPYSYSRRASPLVNSEYRGKIDALAGAVDFLQKNRSDYVVLADGDIVANLPIDEIIQTHEDSGNLMTMVCVKKTKDSPFTTYVEINNRKKEVTDIRVGDCGDGRCKYIALGVYVMRRDYLIHLIADCVTHNCVHFERELLRHALSEGTIGSYLFTDYAVKVEDTKDYFAANMDMLEKEVRDQLFLRTRPVYTRIRDEAPAYYGDKAEVDDSLIADGCYIEGTVSGSILFRDVHVDRGAKLENCIVMQSGRILSGASLAHVITDRGVTIREGRTMMGHENYPVVIAKSSIV